jgi:hypothetical protein
MGTYAGGGAVTGGGNNGLVRFDAIGMQQLAQAMRVILSLDSRVLADSTGEQFARNNRLGGS